MQLLDRVPLTSVDLVFTSPPYANQRQKFYESIPQEEFPARMTRWMNSCIPSLKPEASIAIVIRPHIKEGKLSDYVIRSRLAAREAGWIECDELIWVKPNSPPIGHNKRPRRSWESILWFSLTNKPYCDPKANGQYSKRIGMVSKKGRKKYISGADLSEDWQDTEGISRCRDYVEVGTAECDHSEGNTHPAQFPLRLAQWVIALLCPPGGTVLDPFMGSGTTALACKMTGRHYYGIDLSEEYCDVARKRLNSSLSVQ